MEIDEKELSELKEKSIKFDLLISTKAYKLFVSTTEEELEELKKDVKNWRRLKEIAKRISDPLCDGCPLLDKCYSPMCMCKDAFELIRPLKTCDGCKDDPICDFCIHFDRLNFICSKHNKQVDPIDVCADYHCFNSKEARRG